MQNVFLARWGNGTRRGEPNEINGFGNLSRALFFYSNNNMFEAVSKVFGFFSHPSQRIKPFFSEVGYFNSLLCAAWDIWMPIK